MYASRHFGLIEMVMLSPYYHSSYFKPPNPVVMSACSVRHPLLYELDLFSGVGTYIELYRVAYRVYIEPNIELKWMEMCHIL